MLRAECLMQRLRLVIVLLLLTLVASACYKDAGDDLEPTSRQVDLTDIAPTTPAPPAPTNTTLPTAHLPDTPVQPAVTATRTLVPTTTPADLVAAPPDVAAPELAVPPADGGLGPTPTQLVPPDMTVEPVTPTPTQILITTPGMNDILPTDTPVPTRDPVNDPLATTPTAIPFEVDPCVHVVVSGDTLYSIAEDNEVSLPALVAANAHYLGGNPETRLQVGWELTIPDCDVELEPTPADVVEPVGGDPVIPPPPDAAGGHVIHTVQPGEGIYAIARQYGVTPEAIIAANNLGDPNLIYPGDQLIIPVGQ